MRVTFLNGNLASRTRSSRWDANDFSTMNKRSRSFVATAVLLLFANNVILTSALKGGYEQLHTYDYEANINVGVDGHVSEYHIDGLLKIQRDVKTDRYMLMLSDLKHDYYYGVGNSERVGESNQVNSAVLQIPFYAEYNEDGLFTSIINPHEEPAWSLRIKKSIATLFHFNQSYVQRGLTGKRLLDEDDDSNIEHTVHGKCEVDYLIIKKNELNTLKSKINLIRDYTLNTCDDFTNDIDGFLTDYRLTKKTLQGANKWDQSSIRNSYHIDFINGVPIIKSITSSESYTYNDNIDNVVFVKDNRKLIVNIRQSLVLNGTRQDDKFLKSFEEYKKSDKAIPFDIKDFPVETNGTGKVLVDRVIDLLTEYFDYTRKSHLDMVNQGEEHRQSFNKALAYLKQLGPADFRILEEKAIRDISAHTLRNIFISMLPYIGTTHSFDFTLDIISRKIISDDLAVKVLATLPIYTLKTIPSLKTFKRFVFDNNGQGETKLSPQVYESAVVSFSHLLSGACSRLAVLGFDDEVAYHYLPFIVRAFEDANTTASKLVFLSAIGNVRSKAAVKYVTPLLTLQSGIAKDRDRLRLAAINILSELINVESDIYPQFASNLTKILMGETESRSIRLSVYDVLVSKSNYALDKIVEVSSMISNDKDLYNYHLSTIEGLHQVGLLYRHAKFRVNPSNTPVSPSLSKTVIVKTDKLLKPELLRSTLKIQSIPRTYLKLSIISGESSTNSDWRIPSVVKLEILERKDERIIVNKGVYFHTNFNGKDIDEGVFFDLWTVFNQNSRPYYMDTIEFKKTSNLLELSDIILQKIQENVNFMYQDLTTFSLKTGFGIEAVYEHKYPSLISMLMDYNWNAEDNLLEAKIDFSFKASSNGYSGVSIYNPLTRLSHSVRKAQKLDGALSFSVIVKFDCPKHQFNLTLPLNFDDSEGKASGLAVYSSTSIGITDANGEITCQNCGFRIASKNIPPASFVKLHNGVTTYNCDPDESLDLQNFLGNNDDDELQVVNTCGYIITLSAFNSSRPSPQIELLVEIDAEILKSWENSWYFLPGYKLNLDSSIGIREITSNRVDYLMKLNFNTSSSQGHFSNILQFKFVLAKKYDYRGDLILCFDGKADFPEIDDNHLPTEVTQSTLNAFARFKVGQSREDSCSAIDFAVDFNLTGGVSEMHRDALENYASQSLCALQKVKWRREGIMYPLTEACLREMIANTTLRHYNLDLTSEKFSDFSLLQALLVIRSAQDKLKEMVANSHNADVEIKMTSPISEIRTRKQMSFAANYPVPDIYKNLPNVYFPQDFVLAFIDKKINVINVYPKTIIFNNEEKLFDALEDWKEIYTGVEKTPYRIYAKVMDYKISLKILYEGYELILKPNLVESKNETYVPQIFYNQQLFSDFHQRLHLFSSEEILFSLSRVDEYIVVRSDQIPATIYYTTSSINIFQRT